MARSAKPADVTARLFDADRRDRQLPIEEALRLKLEDQHLLWLDVARPLEDDESQLLAERLGLDPRSVRTLREPGGSPVARIHKDYVHFRVGTLDKTGAKGIRWLDIVAAENVVLTAHSAPIALLANLDDRIEADATLGRIDAAGFASVLLDAAVTSYFTAADGVEELVDRLDAKSLRRDASVDLLPALVDVRRQIAHLRRALTDHREVFAAISRSDVSIASNVGDFSGFPAVSDRFERAIAAVDNTRDVLLGSFDVYMTRTAQRTNEIMKVLALASVLLLPGSLLAGMLGMNMPGPFAPDDPHAFWIVVAVIAAIALATLVIARQRRWI